MSDILRRLDVREMRARLERALNEARPFVETLARLQSLQRLRVRIEPGKPAEIETDWSEQDAKTRDELLEAIRMIHNRAAREVSELPENFRPERSERMPAT